MVTTELNPDTGDGHIVLTPNNSASWRFNLAVWASLTFIAALISTVFLFMGLWMIFPFSGLEVLALYAGLHYVAHRNSKTEVITFCGDKVIVEKGRYSSERIWEYQRFPRLPETDIHPLARQGTRARVVPEQAGQGKADQQSEADRLRLSV